MLLLWHRRSAEEPVINMRQDGFSARVRNLEHTTVYRRRVKEYLSHHPSVARGLGHAGHRVPRDVVLTGQCDDDRVSECPDPVDRRWFIDDEQICHLSAFNVVRPHSPVRPNALVRPADVRACRPQAAVIRADV